MSEGYKTTKRKLRVAPTPVLERTQRLFEWVGHVAFLGILACLLLGVWVDWRWFVTNLLPLLAWVIAHLVDDLVTAELERRRTEANGCPDRLG